MPAEPLALKVERNSAAFAAGAELLRQFLVAAGASTGGTYRAELVFEELVVNIIRHAGRGQDMPCTPIDVSAGVEGGEIILTIEDDGDPFDPSQAPIPQRPSSIREARPGGLGLQLVHGAATRLAYERLDGRNRITVAIRLD